MEGKNKHEKTEKLEMNKLKYKKKIWTQSLIVFIATFLAVYLCTFLINQNQKKREELKAVYTAESTISRIEAQLNRYLAESELIQNAIENGHILSDGEFSELCRLMQDNDTVIKVHEIAKDGIVSQVYPLKGNEKAIGLNMIENAQRKTEAELARDSGEYTIAGPYELVQGGTGVLLFDPVYATDAAGNRYFWGFSILVIDWPQFIKEMNLEKLEEAGYHYQIWKKNADTGEPIEIAKSKNYEKSDDLEVACKVPNDTWYFEIIPENGWITSAQKFWGVLIALLTASIMVIMYLQFRTRRYKEADYEAELEKSAREAREANEAKTRFLFNMSHDIRTPMNAIMGFSDLLEKHIDEKEKVLDYINKIKSSSAFLLSLINYVLEMARIESGKVVLRTETRCITELINSLTDVFEPEVRKKQITYSCKMDIEHQYVLGDETKVREIFINIIGNSLKYTQKGGRVSVKVTEIPSEKEGYTSYKIVIEDNGIGMSEEYLPHIFEEFSREKTSTESKVTGTGLGLPIVKSLVTLMGGSIEVESQLGKGTKTTVILPFQIASEKQIMKEQQKDKKPCPQDLADKRILLAEDNDLNAEITMTVLEENGLKAERVADGEKCVEAVRKMPADYFDMILMDIQMPGLDGYEATKQIRSLGDSRAQIPIIAMTANAFDEDRKKAFDAGMNGHIAKPVDLETLFETMARTIKQTL